MHRKKAYRITLRDGQQADSFALFVETTYFPAVHRGPTRVGQVLDLSLWSAVEDTGVPEGYFLLEMGFEGLPQLPIRVDDAEVESAFDAYCTMEELGVYEESAVWPASPTEESAGREPEVVS